MNLALPQANQFAKFCLAFLFISLQYNKSIMKTGAMAKPAGLDSNRLLKGEWCWEKWCSKMSNNHTIHVPICDVCLTPVETSKRDVTEQGRCFNTSSSDSVNISLVNNSFLFFNWSGNLEDNSSSLSYFKINIVSNCTFCSADCSCLLLVSTPNSSCPPPTPRGVQQPVRNEISALVIAIGAVGGALVLLIVVLCILFRSKARRRRKVTLPSGAREDAVQFPQSPESSTREENEAEQDDVNSEFGSPSSVSSGEKDEDIFVSPPQMENPLRNDVGYVYSQDGKMALYSEGNSDRYSYPKFGTDSYQADPADCYSYPVLRDGLYSGDSAGCYSYPELRDGLYSGDSADGYSYPDLTDIPKVNGDTGEYCYAYAHTFNRPRKPKCPHYVNVSLKKPKTCNSDSTRLEPKRPHYENVSLKKTKTCNSDSTRLEPEANVESLPIVEYIEACSDNEHNKAKESNDDVDTLNSTQHEENVESPVNVEYIPVL